MKRSLVSIASAVLLVTALVPAWAATDPFRSRQWGLSQIRADQAAAVSTGAGVTIAVVDTGIDLDHPDLKSKIGAHYSCLDGSCGTGGNDDHGHGTHVAGIAAAATNNGTGIAGVAPAAKLMAVKVLDENGSGSCGDITLGIRWAADHGADVINLSLGPEIVGLGVLCVGSLESAAEYAFDKGIVVAIAAGNDGLFNLYSSPAFVVVGATGPDDGPARYSNSGADVYAPGGDRGSAACAPSTCIFSTWIDGYASVQGTSMATPHVAGIASLMLARGYSASQIPSRLRSTADVVNGIPRVNAERAVGLAGTSPKPAKSSSPAGPTAGSTRSSRTPTATAEPSVLPTKLTVPSPSTTTLPSEGGAPLASRPRPVSGASPTRTSVIVIAATVFAVMSFVALRTVRRRSPRT